MNNFLQKIISLLIIFCLMLQTIPVYALDLWDSDIVNKKFKAEIETSNDLEEKREIAYEIISKREEDKKYFKMSDGSEMVNIYATPIHFEQNNKYVEINNELISVDGSYVNKKAPYVVRYEKKNSNEGLLELEKNGYTLSMTLNNSKSVKAVIPKDDDKIKTNVSMEKDELVSNVASEIEYNEIKDNIDITYTTLPNKVKESIILKEKKTESNFEYIIKTNKPLDADVAEHNIIEFKDGENVIFSIDTPYMYDSEFNLSTDIDVKLEKIDEGYKLLIKPDKKWLDADDRKYPVVIDPTVNTSQIRNQIDDLFIYEGDDNVDTYAKANQHILRVGSNRFSSTKGNPTRSLIRFNIPKLDTGDQVIDAKLALYSYACSLESGISCPAGKNIEINAHKVTKDWNDNNARWSYLGGNDSYDSRVVDYQVFQFDWNNEVKLYQFDITSIVKDWYISGKNNGLMLKENNEVKNLQREDAYFFSSDINDKYASARPVASITYRNQTGLEDYQTFSTHSVGNIDASVNNYNGNLVLTHNDISTPGSRLPVSINHIYNTNDKDINIGYGNGFRLNLNQSLVLDGNYMKYIDEDGTRHWFTKNGDNYIDEDGLNLKLIPVGSNYKMEDKEGNVSIFTKNNNIWYLTEIMDTSGNKITINLNASNNNLISSVSDASGDTLTFTYANNLLSKITDQANREIKYGYANNNLLTITYPDNEIQKLEYNNNLVTKIVDVNSSYNTYEYYPNSPYRLKKISEFGTNGSKGNNLDFTYGENTTSIKNIKGKKTNYLFNNLGLTTSITDLGDSKSVENAYGQEFTYNTSDGKDKNRLTSEGKLIKNSNNNDVKQNDFLINDGAENNEISWDFITRGQNEIKTIESEKYKGNKSFEISSTINDNFSVEMLRPFDGEVGKTYTISAYIKGKLEEKGENGGVIFDILYMNMEVDDNNFISTKVFDISEKWKKYSFTFTFPKGMVRQRIGVGIKNAKGTIYVDNIQMIEGEIHESDLGPENLITNSGFDNDLNGIISETNIKSGDGIYNDNGNKVLKLNGDSSIPKTFSKFIDLKGNKGDVLNFSFWALNNGIINVGSRQNRLLFELYDLNGKIFQQENIQISPDNHEWQFINKYIIAKGSYTKVKLSFASIYQKGYILFDNIGLYKNENPNTYTYDGQGNVISSVDAAKQNNDFEYERNNQLSSSTNSRGRTTLYEYDYNHKNRLTRTFMPDGMEIKKDYDNYGNVINEKTSEKKAVSLRDIDPNKSYYIKTINDDLYLSLDDVNKNEVYFKLDNKNDNAKFTFSRDKNGFYEIFPANSTTSKLMDSQGAYTYNGAAIQLYTKLDLDSQKFKITDNQDGSITLRSKHTNFSKCVDVKDGKFILGNAIQSYDCNSSTAQRFVLVETTDVDFDEVESVDAIKRDKTYYIKSLVGDLYVQPNDSNVQNETKIELNDLSERAEWILKEKANGTFMLESNYKKGMQLDVPGGYDRESLNLQMWVQGDTENVNQVFDIYHNSDGTFTFKIKVNNYKRCVDIRDGFVKKNVVIQQYTCNNSYAQKFVLLEKESNGRKYIETKSEYNSTGDYKIKDIDERGKTTSYTYDENKGNLSSMVDSKGNNINYEYNIMDKVTKIKNGNTVNTFIYDKNKLKTIEHNGFNYNFEYDEFGNVSSTKVGNQNLITNNYEGSNGNLIKSIYGNGNVINYTYDRFDRVSSRFSDKEDIKYTYDTRGNLAKIYNDFIETSYVYDLSDRLIEYDYNDLFKINYNYNKYNEMDKIDYLYKNTNKSCEFKYDVDGKVIKVNNVKYSYDKLNRVIRKNFDSNYDVRYSYYNVDDLKTTNIIKTITNGNDKFYYTYDDNGNIESVKENGVLTNEYEYDNLNQLVKEHDKKLNKTITYIYDNGGNILNKKYYEYKTDNLLEEINYNYSNENWKDQLTSYNGKNITYDNIGNPLTYDDIIFTWKNGRQLESYKAENKTVTYNYNEEGIRTDKKINDKTYKYYLDDSDIIFEETPNGTIYYQYDADGIIGFEYNNKNYYYVKNQQSDIIGLLDDEFNKIATYTYDSWGKIISITDSDGTKITDKNNVALINPFRYRSYYYDSETGMYYLNSRYYHPDMGRFLNADRLLGANEDEVSYNLYAYTSNNPVSLIDVDGDAAWFIPIVANFGKQAIKQVVKTAMKNVAKNTAKGTSKNIVKNSTSTSAKQLSQNYAKGRAAEQAVSKNLKLPKNTKSFKINNNIRIPDFMGNNKLVEVKYVKTQSFTKQLRDYNDYSKIKNMKFELFTKPDTKLSKPLQEAVDRGDIVLKQIPKF